MDPFRFSPIKPRSVEELTQIADDFVQMQRDRSSNALHRLIAAWTFQEDGCNLLEDGNAEDAFVYMHIAKTMLSNIRTAIPDYSRTDLRVADKFRLSRVSDQDFPCVRRCCDSHLVDA